MKIYEKLLLHEFYNCLLLNVIIIILSDLDEIFPVSQATFSYNVIIQKPSPNVWDEGLETGTILPCLKDNGNFSVLTPG